MATTNKHISSFEYLGSKIDELGRTEADVKSRVNKARQVFASLNKIWNSRPFYFQTKLRLFISNVVEQKLGS